jgi:hypothetical protein
MTRRIAARRIAGARRGSSPSARDLRLQARPAVGVPTTAVAAVPVPHLDARSVLAGGPTFLPAPDSLGPPPAPPRRSRVRRRLAVLLVAVLVVGAAAVAFAGTRVVLARFADAAAVTGSIFATGSWATGTTWYLHNNPTPPTANTAAQFNLSLDATAPTAGTLYNYDTNCESRAGRSINRNTGLVTEAGSCRYATWRSGAFATARTLNGTATLTIWARKSSTGGTNPTLRAFLRVFDPATSTYVELGSASASITNDSSTAWAAYSPTWSLASVAVPAGRRIEVKVVATGGNRNVEIAYDANNLASALSLP